MDNALAQFEQSTSIKELASALSKAQAEVMKAHKDSNNPFFKSKYADLTSVWDAIREPLTGNGLAIVQAPMGSMYLVTMLMHSSGEYLRFVTELKCKDPLDPQKHGSAITYARRYALSALMGVCPEDDDGNSASRPAPKPDTYSGSPQGKSFLASMFKQYGVTDVDEMTKLSDRFIGKSFIEIKGILSNADR